jgi:hypothetical protein
MTRTIACFAAISWLGAALGCGGDDQTTGAQTGASGSSQSGTGGATGSGGTSHTQGGSQNTAGTIATGALDGSADDGGPYLLPDLDTTCGGGPTGKQLLGFIHLPYTGTFSPPTKRASMYPWNGPTTPSALTVGAEYKGGAILCMIDHYVCPGGGVPCRVQQPPTVTVELNVTFKSANGVFDEALTAVARYEPGITNVSFQGELPATKIGGTYSIVTGTKEQVKLVFMGQFENSQYNGSISEVGQGVSIPGGSWAETTAGADASSDH